MNYGATPQEWAHFDVVLGLTEDLLPVVSNPNAVISPQSKMKGLGKTPSRYNRQREVAGIEARLAVVLRRRRELTEALPQAVD